MTENLMNSLFPYGTFPVDPVTRDCYMDDYSRACSYPLPDQLPYHHPFLQRLEGTYPLDYALPPWWPTCISQVEPTVLQPLLAVCSAHEFRAGCLDQRRWKEFRETLTEEERRRLPQSPKIAPLVERSGWATSFGNRGSVETPDRLKLIISTRPLDFLYMANGREWHSCQHLRDGCENQQLPGNFYDTNVAVAMLLLPDSQVRDEEAVLVRTTLRVFHTNERTILAIGRVYHNHETLAFLLLRQLAHLFDTQHLSWGFMTEINAYYSCREGSLGPELRQRLDQYVEVESEPCWLPHGWHVPYVDGGAHQWYRDWEQEHDEYYRTQLNATVQLLRPCPPPAFTASAQMRHALSQHASVDMLPCFL